MPRSKHRRKAGGKAVKRPGYGNAAVGAWDRLPAFHEIYSAPFYAARAGLEAGYVLDLVVDAGFDSTALTFYVISRDELFASFRETMEEEAFTLDQAVAALASLVEQDMVVVDGDQVLIPPRFVDAFYRPSVSNDSISVMSVS